MNESESNKGILQIETHEIFLQNKNDLERDFGIALTTIELVGLQKISEDVVLARSRGEDVRSHEPYWRFLDHYYGITLADYGTHFENVDAVGREKFREWMRREQKRLHNET